MDRQAKYNKLFEKLQNGKEMVKYEATGNLQLYCEYIVLTFKNPVWIEGYLRFSVPALELDSDAEAELFHVMINTLKENKYGLFRNDQEEFSQLFNYCATQYNSAKQKGKLSSGSEGERGLKILEPNPNQTLSDLITHPKSAAIVEGLKIQYKNIKGKRLKLLLLALQELALLPNDRIAKKFHDCCKAEFDWYIASYTAMNDQNYNQINQKEREDLENMKEYIKSLSEQTKPLA